MLLNLDEIPPEGIEVEAQIEPDDPALGDLDLKGPLTGSFRISKMGQQILVRGRVASEVHLRCARCLEEFDLPVSEDVDLELRPILDLDRSGQERELGSDDLDVEFFRGDALDLSHLAAEQVLLGIPMKPLCREDCRGICPLCGADKTVGSCRCEPDSDPRWNALRDLKEKWERKT